MVTSMVTLEFPVSSCGFFNSQHTTKPPVMHSSMLRGVSAKGEGTWLCSEPQQGGSGKCVMGRGKYRCRRSR